MFFLEFSCFFYDSIDVGNLISGCSAFSKSNLYAWKFTVHVQLKPNLENFEDYFASMWDERNYAVVWTFFGIAFLWDQNENWPFQSCGHCQIFQICWHIQCIIREMQIKTIGRYYLTQVRIVVIKKSTNNKFWRVCGIKWILLHCLWEYNLVQTLWRTVWRFLKKLKLELPCDLAIPLLGI